MPVSPQRRRHPADRCAARQGAPLAVAQPCAHPAGGPIWCPFRSELFASPLTSVNGAPDSAGEAPRCPESPRQDPPTGQGSGTGALKNITGYLGFVDIVTTTPTSYTYSGFVR